MGHDEVDVSFDASDRVVGLRNRLFSGARAFGRFLGDLGHALGALGDLLRRRPQLAHRRRDLIHRGGLLLGACRLLIGCGLQLAG